MSRRSATQAPKPPPFPIGARLKYVGTSTIGVGADIETCVWILFPGAIGTIVKVNPGRRGTGRACYDEDGPMIWEDTGEPILDDTQDGYSVWVSDVDPRNKNNGRCIDLDDVAEWELIVERTKEEQ